MLLVVGVHESRALKSTVVKDCFQPVELVARHIQLLVQHKSDRMLPNTPSHNHCLVIIHDESFLNHHRSRKDPKPVDRPCEFMVTGEQQIVGISSVHCVRFPREPGKSAVKAICTDVGDGR